MSFNVLKYNMLNMWHKIFCVRQYSMLYGDGGGYGETMDCALVKVD